MGGRAFRGPGKLPEPLWGEGVKVLLAFSRGVDWFNTQLAVVANWLVLLAALISAGNAASRYVFSESSNGWLEIQWYMFAGFGTHADLDRYHRRLSIPAADLHHPHLFHVAVVCRILEYQRSIVECGRLAALAGKTTSPGRIRLDGAARHFGNHQAHRCA